MRRYEQYILTASQLIKQEFAEPANGIEVPEVYKGYIASLGSSIRQSGLIAALSFYTSAGAAPKTTSYRRNQVMKVILQLIKEPEIRTDTLIKYTLMKIYSLTDADYNRVPINLTEGQADIDVLEMVQTKIENAAIAVKLALRSFEMGKTENQNND